MGKSPYLKRIYISLIVLYFSILIGIAGYMWNEKLPFLDSPYMTIITITTVGFGEVTTLSSQGQILTIGIILSGTGTMAYVATSL